ncbi:hypothetical protein EJ02DRAFT_482425 [Clathrospora elynae]|uniref:Peptidase A2 domain-containing protein n=1 Tax=Clathrospora elynae TaxID=706981 RepID=A0A6A5SU49_9PLEO|nr:hypothetical protein EJ02DRAFT_482425 [Clathrospora elynae]
METFDGKEVTEFLDEYNRKANNAQLSSEQKVLVLPDFCDAPRRAFMKRLKSYVNVNWAQLQEDMKEHWRDSNTSQQRGTRAYLKVYVQECSQTFPGISEYYTNFLVISDACILAKQVHKSEQGYLFVRGLPQADKELVFMHMEDGPREIDVGTFDMDKIYNFVCRLYCQREGIMQTPFSQAKEDARQAQIAVEASRQVTPSDIRSAVKDLQSNRSILPQGVDQEVQDLIDAMAGTKISTAENIYTQNSGGNYQGQGKPGPSNNTRQVTYYYGPQHKQFGEIKGPVPYRNQLHWLKEKIWNFFEVTNDMLDQPASSMKAEMFDRMDSRGRAQGNSGNQVDFRPSASKPSGQGNTVTIKQRRAGSPAPKVELAEFQERCMFPSHNPEPLISLDYINAQDIVLAKPSSGEVHSMAFATTRLQEKSNQNTDKVLEQFPIPPLSQAHNRPFAVIKPPTTTSSDFRNLLADPDNLQPARRKKVQIEGMADGELWSLLRPHANRIPTAMLNQEVQAVEAAENDAKKDTRGTMLEVNVAESNLTTQMRHWITGVYDTYNEALNRVTHCDLQEAQRAAGFAFVQSELPTCWATIGPHAIRCLIDTGAQMNLMQVSAANALKIPYEEANPDITHKEGVISANRSMDPFLGAAWDVALKIGQVTTNTHFWIIKNLTRSAILGAPWCASSQLGLQYNVFGRVTCCILDSTGKRNATFIASDPALHHPQHMARVDNGKDLEN